MSNDPLRYTFIFTPPKDDAACWGLKLADFAETLNNDFPDSSTSWDEGALGPLKSQSLSFELEIMPEEWLEGIVSTPYPNTGSVVLELATPLLGAAFAKWLRDSYVPSSAPIEVVTELALENGVDDVRIVPSTGDLASIVRVLEDHVALVEEETGG
ncbi:hypothetical protein [Streptomyces albus]|uniref:hypothetical protein n=1 Tax=Streptomyces TaxID=1883 RepID=UPI00131E1A71|nr:MULTISPECIES: hypothetical protein [Streptomyces]MDI6408154.1 hypothetical protein [Streptomyces albus]